MRLLKILGTALIALFITLFAVNNSQVVTFDLWPFPHTFQCMLSMVILISFTLGAFVAGSLVWVSQIMKRLSSKTKESQKSSS